MCVCTCGWVLACTMRIPTMCVKEYICLVLCPCTLACVHTVLAESGGKKEVNVFKK